MSNKIITLSGLSTFLSNIEDYINNLLLKKQDTLVSGNSIKTINNTSLLGEGNIELQEPLVSGINIRTINENDLLGNGNVIVGNIATVDTSLELIDPTSDIDIDYSTQYFTIESLENENQVSFTADIIYSTDGSSWNTLNSGESILINNGDKVRFKGTLIPTSSGIGKFSTTQNYKVYGNIMSLIHSDDFIDKTSFKTSYNYVFTALFANSTTLIDTSELILPATTLTQYCYQFMFSGCTNLISAPELPATTLANSCYQGMFQDCASLTITPELPATNLVHGCYQIMFDDCTGLTTAPALPATTLASSCYSGMFQNCTNLTTAPELSAATLVNYCYNNMFSGCSKLNYIKMLATDISADHCMYAFASRTASSGTFVKHPDIEIPRGQDGIPYGWTIVNAEL